MNTSALLTRIALIWLAATVVAGATASEDSDLEKARERVSAQFDEIEPQHVNPGPVPGWFTIRKGAIVAYISSDGRFLMQGDMIDLDLQVNLSEIERNKARVEMMAEIPESQMITFSPENPEFSIMIFTDIDCGYCRRLHAQIEGYMDEGIEINYLLYPRGGPASESWVKAEQVWCASDRNEALTLAKLEKDFETHSCDSSTVNKHYAIGRDVGLTGTPAIILPDGSLMPGYLPPDQLRAQLDSTVKVASN